MDAWKPVAGPSVISFAVVLWFASLRHVELADLSDTGLVSALPVGCFIALLVITGTFASLLDDAKRHRALLATTLVAFLVMLYGAPAVVGETARFSVTWRHVGVIEHIRQVGTVDPDIDAYFNWPGFFVLGAFLSEAARIDLLAIANWFPTFLNILYIFPLWVIFARFTNDERQRWLALWVFFMGNWVAQDYLSPQGLSFFLYLAVCASVLTVFTDPQSVQRLLARLRAPRSRGAERRLDTVPLPSAFGSTQRAGLVIVIVVVFAAVVSGHQLTPFAIVVAVAALALMGASSARLLPVLMTAIIGAWSAFMAVAYFKGHFQTLLANVLEGTVESNVTSRLGGSPGHLMVVQARLALTFALWALAVLGAVRSMRRGDAVVPVVILSVAPFLLVPLQPYGGEMLMRVYLFGLPFVALLAAAAFPACYSGRGIRTSTAAVAAMALLMTGGFLLARYGNERMDQFTRAEVHAVEVAYQHGPPDSRVVAATRSVPWKFRDYEKHRYLVLQDFWRLRGDDTAAEALVRSLAKRLEADRRPAYVILSRSQEAEGEMMGAAQPGFLRRLDAALRRSSTFRVLSDSRDAAVFVFKRAAT
ncbi:MAG: hypothetical protein H0V68_01560 [Actinobacteria bacterium]|nr:hypothetical protein [Actinomycetota bacterium]